MLCMETILKVRRLSLKPGLSQRAIAKQLQISRRTISKYLAIETKEPPAYKRDAYNGFRYKRGHQWV
ncbi:putative transposase [Yersinia ruckeri]|nr:putative transposase [Yersinia ruckeri]